MVKDNCCNKYISFSCLLGYIYSRIKILEEDRLDGIILAAAGVKSLNLDNKIGISFEIKEVLPAVGQGIIAVQCNKSEDTI